MHGIGVIEAIELKTVLGEEDQYYILRFFANNMTAMIPVTKAEAVGLRPLISAETCRDVLDVALRETIEESENRNQRYRDNLERMRSGNIYDTLDVVKCLTKRSNEKGLSAGEKRMYTYARDTLVSELALASACSEDEICTLIGL
jgi:CarD family transcriptional regulator